MPTNSPIQSEKHMSDQKEDEKEINDENETLYLLSDLIIKDVVDDFYAGTHAPSVSSPPRKSAGPSHTHARRHADTPAGTPPRTHALRHTHSSPGWDACVTATPCNNFSEIGGMSHADQLLRASIALSQAQQKAEPPAQQQSQSQASAQAKA